MEASAITALALGVIDKSIATVKKLREIDLKMQAAEYKDALADLLTNMADLKVQLVELKEENLKLQQIINGQDQKTELRKKFVLDMTVYELKEEVFGLKPGRYCPHCFEGKGEIRVLINDNRGNLLCNTCKGHFHGTYKPKYE